MQPSAGIRSGELPGDGVPLGVALNFTSLSLALVSSKYHLYVIGSRRSQAKVWQISAFHTDLFRLWLCRSKAHGILAARRKEP